MQAHLVKWYRGEVWEESFKRFLGRRAYARHTAWKQILDLQSLKKHDAELNDVRNRLRVLARKLQNANGQKDAQAALDEIRKLIPRINSASKRFTKTFKATVSDAVKVSKQEDRLFYKIARAEQAGRQLVRDTLADIVNRERKKTRRMLEKGKLTEAQAKKRLTEVKKITVELDRRNDSHWQELRRQLNEELDKFTEKSRRQLGNASTIGKVVDLREFVNKLDTPAVARRIKVAARAVKDDRLAEIPLEKSIKRSRDFQSFERNVAQLYALYHDEIHRTASIAEMAKVLFHRLPTSLAELQSIQTLTGNKRKVRLHLDDILRYLAKMLRKVERQDTMLEHEVAAA